MVGINNFPTQAHFVHEEPPLTTVQAPKLFFKYVFKYHRMTVAIVYDRDPHFTGRFLQELFKLQERQLQIVLHASSPNKWPNEKGKSES